ncbi:MAG TPA: ABC transporter permease, partial [Gemmatimonadales bacterium]|nr:ABC transporter permease [Gemmatimonadales bacterium]
TRATLARIDRERRMQQRRASRFEDLVQDVGYAFRGFRRQPGFALMVVLTLGLGIGANATMFRVMDRLLLRPPAFLEHPDRSGRVYIRRPVPDGAERIENNLSYRRYTELSAARSFEAAAAFYDDQEHVVGSGESARQMDVSLVSASFWPMFDISPALGRFFGEEEDRTPGGSPVVVLGYGFWQSEFAGDPGVIGKQLLVGPRPYTVIGVAPDGFNGMSTRRVAAFIPITAGAHEEFGDRYFTTHNISWLEMLARRKPGVSAEAADADVTLTFQQSLAAQPESRPEAIARSRAELASALYQRGPNRSNDARVAVWLAGVAAIVLLIACANVANLLLGRALRRRRELAVRIALGAGRRRLLRQLLTESSLLALLGGGAGLLVARFGGGVLQRALLPGVDWSTVPLLDSRMLLFAAAMVVITGLLTGLIPAWHAGRTDLTVSLKAGGREGSRSRARVQTGLLVAQAAMSVMLLVGAGLFLRSLRNVHSVDLGYDPFRMIVVQPIMRGVRLTPAERGALTQRLLDRARAIPGVEKATLTFGVPFWRSNTMDLFLPGRDSLSGLGAFYGNSVAEDYFDATGTTIRRGRPLTLADRSGPAQVAVVSETLAEKLWPGKDPIGQCVKINADTMPCTSVVGVARDVRWGSLGDNDRMQIYLPKNLEDSGWLFIRTAGDPARLVEPLRRELQRVMPGAAYVNVRSVSSTLDFVLRPWRLGATMFTLFGGLALVVAAVGLYGVIAYSVTQRTHEMGVRAALGAKRGDLLRLVMGEGLRITVVGIVLGAAASLAAGRFLASLLFGVTASDPGTFILVAVVLLGVAGLASVIPAWRAARADPTSALRADS